MLDIERVVWAKTFQSGEIKSLVAHLLDVAAVAQVIQEQCPARLRREAAVFGLHPDSLARLRVWLAGLHDLGKCSAAFQAKSPDNWPGALLGGYSRPNDPGHWRLTATLLRHKTIWGEVLSAMPKSEPQALRNILSASVGHHGRPPDELDWKRPIEPAIGAAALTEALKIFREITRQLPPPEDLALDREASKALSWQASGLITFADWVGSDAEYFGPDVAVDLPAYFDAAKENALRALKAKGLMPQAAASRPGLAAVARDIHEPRPMQVWADSVELPDGPCLAVLEDVTGSGKTEAALALASRMIAAGKAEGIYFALPTEATANAMFLRLEAVHRGLYAPDARPSLVLSHGRAHLNEPFARIRNASDDTAEAQCNAWIADHRRKAFFADVGAGTIDQAFLAVLLKRHLTLRQYGLAGRILIVDEAHAYDSYMEEELSRLLELHALSGGSAIVLSATLPAAKLRSMVKVYNATTAPRRTEFPLATMAGRDSLLEEPVPAATTSFRSVEVRRVASTDEMHRLAAKAAASGAAVLVLRNSVDEAIKSTHALREENVHDAELFHARFAQIDRAAIEDRVLRRFGSKGSREERTGRVLVATQVVEQSLDVDFDVIFTDLAPVDLVIQRAGRLWRHQRDHRPLSRPVLHLLCPDLVEATHPDWLAPVLGKGAHVYRNPAILWRSARVLLGIGEIAAPSGLRVLVEAVYGPEAEPPPSGLERMALSEEGIEHGNRAQAGFNTIKLSDGYGVLGDLPADQDIGTRLGEETRILRLAVLENDIIKSWADGPQAWPRSEIRVRASWLSGASEAPELEASVANVKRDWPDWERERNGPLIGVVMADGRIRLEGGRGCLRYDRSLGLSRTSE